jgi:hypothetical protein
MTVEANPASTTVYIDDLDATYPTGTDVKSEGDNHFRLIKRVLLNTFPSVDAPVTATASELNILDGATLSTAELNILDGVTASAAELNILDGVTATASELNLLAGRTSLGATSGTAKATTSGTSVEYTGLPAGLTRITLSMYGVSTNGASGMLVQLGDSGGYETSGYISGAGWVTALETSNAGFDLGPKSAAGALCGALTLTLLDAATNTWAVHGVVASGTTSAVNNAFYLGGAKALSGTLDRIRITSTNGSDAFDAGLINILYE